MQQPNKPQQTILVMGASGAAGGACLVALRAQAPPGTRVLAATRGSPGADARVLDLEWSDSWAPALEGVTGEQRGGGPECRLQCVRRVPARHWVPSSRISYTLPLNV